MGGLNQHPLASVHDQNDRGDDLALARCEKCGRPQGRRKDYTFSHVPVAHPDGGIVCGSADCENPGVIWLTDEEQRRYRAGERVFGFGTNTIKVHLH